VASGWILFFSYQDDARSNTHQICCVVCLVVRDLAGDSGAFITLGISDVLTQRLTSEDLGP